MSRLSQGALIAASFARCVNSWYLAILVFSVCSFTFSLGGAVNQRKPHCSTRNVDLAIQHSANTSSSSSSFKDMVSGDTHSCSSKASSQTQLTHSTMDSILLFKYSCVGSCSTHSTALVLIHMQAANKDPIHCCGTERSPENMFTYSEHREYRSLLGKLQWLQLQASPDLSYEVNRAAQRSSAPTVADARALNAISLKAQRSSETILRYPRGVINVSTAQLVTCGDASFANMEGSKSQCGVIVFLTHEPRRFWHAAFQLGHLVYWTSSTIKRVVRSTLAAEAYSVSEAVEEAQWLLSVLAEMWPSVPSSLPRSLRTVEMDSLRRPIVTLSDSFNLCPPNRDSNAETSLLWSTGSDTCVCHNSHGARRCFDEGSGPLSFVACGDERTPPRVRDLRFQHMCEDNPQSLCQLSRWQLDLN